MSQPLCERVRALVVDVLDRYRGAFLVWCDPRGDWAPLLERAAAAGRGFELVEATDAIGGEPGGPRMRAALQSRIDRTEAVLLRGPAPEERLGRLWAQALPARRGYN